MAKYELKLNDSNIEEIILNRHGDRVEISADDAGFFDRFVNGYKKIEKMANEMPDRLEAAEKEPVDKEGSDISRTVSVSTIRVDFCGKAIEIIDGIFGEGTVKKYFCDDYEKISDFLPDEYKFFSFLDTMTPIMEDIFNRKMERQDKDSRARMAKYETQDRKKKVRK